MEDFSNPRSSASACLKGVAGSDETDQGGVLRREAMSSRRDDDEAGDDSDDDSVSGGGGEGKTEGGCTGSSCNTGGGGGGNVDKLATIRREKRLAMNRESARNRRKRKKVLIQTLEVQLDEVSRSNQQYKLANESLSAKVRALENELAVARDTIGQLTSAAAAAATVTGNHAHLQQRFGAHNHPGAAASLAPSHNDNNFDFGEHHQFRHGTASTVADVQHRGDSLGRLMQAQLDHYALQTGGTSGIPFASAAVSGAGGGSQFTDDSILRRHAIELQALSQASQNSATLGSMVNVSRFAPNAMGERNHQSLGIPGSPLGINPCPEVFHSMVSIALT